MHPLRWHWLNFWFLILHIHFLSCSAYAALSFGKVLGDSVVALTLLLPVAETPGTNIPSFPSYFLGYPNSHNCKPTETKVFRYQHCGGLNEMALKDAYI